MTANLLTALKTLEAQRAVGASTARGQGKKGLVRRIRKSLMKVHLIAFSGATDVRFARILDAETHRICRELPKGARSWGLARKCLNIFLRNCAYNAHLRTAFGLRGIESFLEIPLDSKVVTELKAQFPRGLLPRWCGVKYVNPGESEVFQVAAGEVAKARSVHRIHLDAFFWAK